ncbi:MAG: prepilin-type N-terminal cleavage/methylation domain-containing protein [Limnohabitans sp.]|nr:prepilin-type N-terminal cleavage/methylation domain-containing protein [Limnohabitans sp.]
MSARTRGWTLLELLVVLALSAVMGAWSLDTYQQWRLRTQRAQARAALMAWSSWLEREALVRGSYPPVSQVPVALREPLGLAYRLEADVQSQSYRLRAVPLGAQRLDACATLVLSSQGEMSTEGNAQKVSGCWGG